MLSWDVEEEEEKEDERVEGVKKKEQMRKRLSEKVMGLVFGGGEGAYKGMFAVYVVQGVF